MDPITQIIATHKVPVGTWGKLFFDYLTTNFAWFFNGIAQSLTRTLEGAIHLVLAAPPIVVVLSASFFAWYLPRSIKLGLATAVGLLFIINLGFWKETIETLVLVTASTAVSMAIGVPLGIAAAHRPWLFHVLRPILDLMQTMPTFVYLVPVLVLFGLGLAPGIIATMIFAIPAPVRLTHLGITSVPKQMIEAGESFGATKRQLLWKVELPAAMPTIMAGLTQCIMLSLSMVVIAALVGANGLGKPAVRALNSLNIPMGLESGLAIVVLAIILDRVCRFGERRAA
ncbi:choline ABC transporter permease subunit [Ensifer sp. ENS06]|uniref:choline ABC transporter permease subunit n=1 Tax=Ensifer sp. ENS06 TaxID=2769276 RepID=UPI000DDF2E23|nr:choline ABC transporter permease subunit [Ensifer sp. ENS06]MBD9624697.1 choline ABC transporter permease subunit [Ensifer sp. ENS06]